MKRLITSVNRVKGNSYGIVKYSSGCNIMELHLLGIEEKGNKKIGKMLNPDCKYSTMWWKFLDRETVYLLELVL